MYQKTPENRCFSGILFLPAKFFNLSLNILKKVSIITLCGLGLWIKNVLKK
ncbi:hypothetical protein CHK_1519 [Christensenella hongkongensis]|uniref:Uncharacterized protein n=1 Tax=Christensenella hongkongensis TaxID=270498 RepID=A0A0M2NL26_9FIRM|nr:hypothetical protein CHK_1519 [Christensenella hongkongensis]